MKKSSLMSCKLPCRSWYDDDASSVGDETIARLEFAMHVHASSLAHDWEGIFCLLLNYGATLAEQNLVDNRANFLLGSFSHQRRFVISSPYSIQDFSSGVHLLINNLFFVSDGMEILFLSVPQINQMMIDLKILRPFFQGQEEIDTRHTNAFYAWWFEANPSSSLSRTRNTLQMDHTIYRAIPVILLCIRRCRPGLLHYNIET